VKDKANETSKMSHENYDQRQLKFPNTKADLHGLSVTQVNASAKKPLDQIVDIEPGLSIGRRASGPKITNHAVGFPEVCRTFGQAGPF
jgi:hypothetical protein